MSGEGAFTLDIVAVGGRRVGKGPVLLATLRPFSPECQVFQKCCGSSSSAALLAVFPVAARGRFARRRHMIDTHTMKVTPNVYCLGDRTGSKCEDVKGTCLTTETFMGPRGRRMLVTSHSLAEVGGAVVPHCSTRFSAQDGQRCCFGGS